MLLGIAFPLLLLAIWHFFTVGRPGSLIPPPHDVWLELQDLAFGGINDDAYSRTLHIHLLASVARVYGGFAMALIVALPLGMLIGRVPLIRQLIDPTIQILRPVPVTAWLPLAMIIFGLGPRSAIFLVFLGAFYPILLNTIFGIFTIFRANVYSGLSGCVITCSQYLTNPSVIPLPRRIVSLVSVSWVMNARSFGSISQVIQSN